MISKKVYIPKKVSIKKCDEHITIGLISHAAKILFKSCELKNCKYRQCRQGAVMFQKRKREERSHWIDKNYWRTVEKKKNNNKPLIYRDR